MFEQSSEHIYLSPEAYEEVKAALKVRGFHVGKTGYIGGAHLRFHGMFWQAPSKDEAEILNQKEKRRVQA